MTHGKNLQVKLLFQALGLKSDLETVPLHVYAGISAQFCSVRFQPYTTWPVLDRLTKLFVSIRPGNLDGLRAAKALSFLFQWRHVPIWAQVAEGMARFGRNCMKTAYFESSKLERLGTTIEELRKLHADPPVQTHLIQIARDMGWPLFVAQRMLAEAVEQWQLVGLALEWFDDRRVVNAVYIELDRQREEGGRTLIDIDGRRKTRRPLAKRY
jgi:hypothetical protein